MHGIDKMYFSNGWSGRTLAKDGPAFCGILGGRAMIGILRHQRPGGDSSEEGDLSRRDFLRTGAAAAGAVGLAGVASATLGGCAVGGGGVGIGAGAGPDVRL